MKNNRKMIGLPCWLIMLIFFALCGKNIYGQSYSAGEAPLQKGKDTLEITVYDSNTITFIAHDLDIFSNINIDSIFHVSKTYMGGSFINEGNMPIEKTFLLGDTLLQEPIKKDKYKIKFLTVDAGVLGGVIRNVFAPGLSFEIGLSFSSSVDQYKCFISADMYYFFSKNEENKYGTQINNFINAGMTINDWGLGLGWGKGNQFEKSAFKVFSLYNIPHTPIHISPELYITSDFKQAFPGFTIRIKH